MKLKIIFIFSIFLIIFLFPKISLAAIYFYFDAENGTIGEYLPNPPFCQTECSGIGEKGTYQSVGGAPQGIKYFHWRTVDNQNSAYTEIKDRSQNLPFNCSFGSTYYLAFFFRFDRIDDKDIWHEDRSSADKGIEIIGDGIRWIYSKGHWWLEDILQNHRYSVWGGNPTYHLNRELEIYDVYPLNQNGYSIYNQIELEYERWYSGVMALKMARDNTGSFALWLNGIKILEYNNIKTVGADRCYVERLQMGGTIAQPYYDAPAHLRKYDALMLTDSWQDIVDGGYLQDPNITLDNIPPLPPRKVTII